MSLPCQKTSVACIGSCYSNLCADNTIAEPELTITCTTSLLEAHLSNTGIAPLICALSDFTAANPQYTTTKLVDDIRGHDYRHLSNNTCFDYAGVGLFSHAQLSSPFQFSDSIPRLPPFYNTSCKSMTLKSHFQYGNQETTLESAMKGRIMDFLKISDEEYTMICMANKNAAFKILAEFYPFHSNKRLVTVYDHESDAVRSMVKTAKKRGAVIASAEFRWPSMRIHSEKLEKTVRKKNKKRGLFVFPLQSPITGRRYPCQWMSMAQEHGWHVVLDACSLGPKEMGSLGLSLIKPEFIVCSFFKIFGEDPSGFTGLFIKKSTMEILETSTADKNIGIISIIPPVKTSNLPHDIFVKNLKSQPSNIAEVVGPFSNPGSPQSPPSFKLEEEGTKEIYGLLDNEEKKGESSRNVIECRYLDHADTVGHLLISRRLSCLSNWLAKELMKLKHPHTEDGRSLVRIYGPQLKRNRGSALAINLFDWRGEKIEPLLVQKLADRSNISLGCGFLRNILFSVKYGEDMSMLLGKGLHEDENDMGIAVINVSMNFMNNFEDAYKLQSFIAKFLDADFIEKERWRYSTLNQTVVEV